MFKTSHKNFFALKEVTMSYLKSAIKKIRKWHIKRTAPKRRKKIKDTSFSIISNNCWAGDVYRYFGISYQTPTVGMYFYADEYIKFLSNLPYYLSCPLEKMSFQESKYQEILLKKGQENKLLARLDDVEIVLLHFPDWAEAKEKWDRRVQRINFDNIIVKFSRQNLCSDEHFAAFCNLPFEKKIFFDNKPSDNPIAVYIPGYEKEEYLKDDISSYRKHMDILSFINS